MRLRTSIALAFAALSFLQVAIVVPLALRNLNGLLSKQQGERVDLALDAVTAELGRTGADVEYAVSELSQSSALEEVARDFQPERDRAAQLMAPRRLNVLSLFDEKGRTLSSGHWPAKLNEPDERLFALTKAPSSNATAVLVDVGTESGPRTIPALATARAVDYGDRRLHVVGGLFLDEAVAAHLKKLAGAARVEIFASGEQKPVAAFGDLNGPAVSRSLPFAAGEIRLHFSTADLVAAEAEILRAFFLLFAIGLTLALLAGLFVSRRITRPIEALTAAAERIAVGAWDGRVEEKASGEVGALVQAFNRMTADLSRTTEQLVQTERVAAWREVARRLAHEIKNPLTPIKMSLETLLAAKKTGSARFPALFEESAGAMLEEVERLARIIDEFSRFARLPKPTLARLDLAELASQVLSLYGATRTNVELASALEPGVVVEADRDQLTQVLVNLVKNAEEAMPGGGRIGVRVRKDGANAYLEVEDTGPGIRPEDRSRIFEPYFTTKQGGTGLGLAIASRICQEHSGRLEVGGEPGRGAIFSVVLPLAR